MTLSLIASAVAGNRGVGPLFLHPTDGVWAGGPSAASDGRNHAACPWRQDWTQVSSQADDLPALESLRPATVHDHEDKTEPDQADGAEADGLDQDPFRVCGPRYASLPLGEEDGGIKQGPHGARPDSSGGDAGEPAHVVDHDLEMVIAVGGTGPIA